MEERRGVSLLCLYCVCTVQKFEFCTQQTHTPIVNTILFYPIPIQVKQNIKYLSLSLFLSLLSRKTYISSSSTIPNLFPKIYNFFIFLHFFIHKSKHLFFFSFFFLPFPTSTSITNTPRLDFVHHQIVPIQVSTIQSH